MAKITHGEFMRRFEATGSWLWRNVEVVSEYEGMNEYVYMRTIHGFIRLKGTYVLTYISKYVSPNSAIDKTGFFINKARYIYGNLYSYKNTEYKNSTTKTSFYCNKHREPFEMTPANFLREREIGGCKKCKKDVKAKRKKYGLDPRTISHVDFVEKFKNTNNWLSKNVEFAGRFIGMQTKVELKYKYGNLKMYPTSMLKYRNNYISAKQAIDPTSFLIKQLKDMYGNDRFYLSNVVFKDVQTDINITCKAHNKRFNITPNLLLQGGIIGCPICRKLKQIENNMKWTHEEFLSEFKKADNFLTRNTKVVSKYEGLSSYIYLESDFGLLQIIPENALNYKEDRLSIRNAVDKNDFFKKHVQSIYGEDAFDFRDLEYINAHTDVKLYCKKHDDFEIKPGNLISHKGDGCQKCSAERLRIERENNPFKRSSWVKNGEKSKNFDSYKLYKIRCWNDSEEFYKIGITYRTIKERFEKEKEMPYDYEVTEIIESDSGRYIWDLEKKIHRQYRDYQYIPKIKFGGMYECFSIDCLDKLKEEIKNIKEDLKHGERSN